MSARPAYPGGEGVEYCACCFALLPVDPEPGSNEFDGFCSKSCRTEHESDQAARNEARRNLESAKTEPRFQAQRFIQPEPGDVWGVIDNWTKEWARGRDGVYLYYRGQAGAIRKARDLNRGTYKGDELDLYLSIIRVRFDIPAGARDQDCDLALKALEERRILEWIRWVVSEQVLGTALERFPVKIEYDLS